MNAPCAKPLTERELRWLRHIAVHGPQSSEFLLELCADTHRCKDTGLRALQKLRESQYLRRPSQQDQIAKADFNPHVYDLTRQSQLFLKGLGHPDTVPPTGHWWHSFLTASITSAIAIEAARRGYRYIPAHEILARHTTTLAIPHGRQKLIPDQLFAIDYGGTFRSFLVEVDRGTEPHRSKGARKSLRRMIDTYAALTAKDAIRRHYGLKSPLLVLFVFVDPGRMAKAMDMLSPHPSGLAQIALFAYVLPGFPRFADVQQVAQGNWRRIVHSPKAVL